MKIVQTVFQKMDSLLGGDFSLARKAMREQDPVSALTSGISGTEKVSYLTYYTLSLLQRLNGFLAFMKPISLGVGIVGIASSAFTFTHDSISIMRHHRYQLIFFNLIWKQEGHVRGMLQSVQSLGETTLHHLLPNWMYEKLQIGQEGTNALQSLIAQMEPNGHNVKEIEQATTLGRSLLETLREYSQRSLLVHYIGQIASILSIVAFAGAFMAFPFVGILVLFVVATALTILQMVVRRGWVENPDGGFSIQKALPSFLQSSSTETHPGSPSTITSDLSDWENLLPRFP